MSEWGSPEWQARNRAWLQQKMQPIDNAYRGLLDKLDYYIPGDYGGKSFGQSVDGLLSFTKEASPGADVRDMRDGSRQTMQGLLGGDMSQSLQGLGLLGLGTIGMVPGAGDVAKSVGKKARATNFKKWFGDSKAVDGAGKPLTVYHGTNKNFEVFDPARTGSKSQTGAARNSLFDGSFFFSKDPAVAGSYSGQHTDMTGYKNFEENSQIIPANLSLKNPVIIDVNGDNWDDVVYGLKKLTEYNTEYNNVKTINDLAKRAYDLGHDGVIVKNVVDVGEGMREVSDTYIAFNPTQIKSIHNRGTYNPKDPNILKSLAPIAGAGVVGAGLLSQEGQKDY